MAATSWVSRALQFHLSWLHERPMSKATPSQWRVTASGSLPGSKMLNSVLLTAVPPCCPL